MSCSAKFKNKLVGDIVRGVREGLDPPPPPQGLWDLSSQFAANHGIERLYN